MVIGYNVIGWLANAVTAINLIPQFALALATSSPKGLNNLTISTLIVGNIFWIMYGLFINSYQIVVASIVQMAVAITLIILKHKTPQKYEKINRK